MNIEAAYSRWSAIYDTNTNRTRDLEGAVAHDFLSSHKFTDALEMGCGTGKNTAWLQTKCDRVISVDLTQAMLDIAATKVNSPHVTFVKADMVETPWTSFVTSKVDLVTFSLVLEHVQDLNVVFEQADRVLKAGGRVYVGELHPMKQITGTKARFESAATGRVEEVTCYTHHTSDFVGAAMARGWTLERLDERFDQDDRTQLPRILGLLFRIGC
ncbi:hypothetical protein H310_13836 [Aphanomyces invadans]|uniref:Methyltransferase type 11 domain-containing protein n=1 Tax=Aphanomyces invadans TaxID=157072 RepID=A0A024TC97_9STRA|nr:hypothetical protein H310_13836 [Aphanomyces invadans]ETV91780.1 hypothetical protein H310_13836 [Aphanomyces invadans]|eukprot:XP_008879706.1 hypothetical protein H310_13836 [Aphanomyces invadans]